MPTPPTTQPSTRPTGIPSPSPAAVLADLPGFADLSTLDWDDPSAVTAAADLLLAALDHDRVMLGELAHQALAEPRLSGLCEHYDILDKLVLHDDETGWRLRLHVFAPGYFDRPHNHRWSYASRILAGSYLHTLYGTDEQLGADTTTIDVSTLRPRMTRTESPGAFYTLHHSMIHSITAQPHTVSLIVRGPAVTDRFLVTDRVTGHAWWQYGAANETPQAAARKRMTPEQAAGCLRLLADRAVLD